jgi:hypothetical protein
MKGTHMSLPVKQAFTELPGLPGRGDPELARLMATAGRLPREGLEEITRSLLRCALGHERTGDDSYLACLAEDALVTMRLRGDPECEKALSEPPGHPAGPAESVDVREMLAQRGL